MESEFSARARLALESIAVPQLAMGSIRHRAESAASRERRILVICSVIALIILGTGVGFGKRIYDGVNVWLSGNKAAVVVGSLVMVREPTAADLRAVVTRMTFPVVLPAGLPPGTRVSMMLYAPAKHPTSLTLTYASRRGSLVGITLLDTASIQKGQSQLPTGSARPAFRDADVWRIGRETVLLPKGILPIRDIDAIKSATLRVSPLASVIKTETMLRRITVLDNTPGVADIAERYAPQDGRSVLLDLNSLRWILSLKDPNKPLLDSRIVYLTNIPSLNGEPQYDKATLSWPKHVIVSAAGVRALSAVMRFAGIRPSCGCAVLFSEQSNEPYRIWVITSSSASVTGYSVDAKTFSVTSLGRAH